MALSDSIKNALSPFYPLSHTTCQALSEVTCIKMIRIIFSTAANLRSALEFWPHLLLMVLKP